MRASQPALTWRYRSSCGRTDRSKSARSNPDRSVCARGAASVAMAANAATMTRARMAPILVWRLLFSKDPERFAGDDVPGGQQAHDDDDDRGGGGAVNVD